MNRTVGRYRNRCFGPRLGNSARRSGAAFGIAVTNPTAERLERSVARSFAPFEGDCFRSRNDHSCVSHALQCPLMIVDISAANTICRHEDLISHLEKFQSGLLHTDMRFNARQYNLLHLAARCFSSEITSGVKLNPNALLGRCSSGGIRITERLVVNASAAARTSTFRMSLPSLNGCGGVQLSAPALSGIARSQKWRRAARRQNPSETESMRRSSDDPESLAAIVPEHQSRRTVTAAQTRGVMADFCSFVLRLLCYFFAWNHLRHRFIDCRESRDKLQIFQRLFRFDHTARDGVHLR